MMARAIINNAELLNSPNNSPKANSAIPLPPGVGLTNINNHNTSCLPKTKKCWENESGKKAARMQLMTKYLHDQEPNVARKLVIQNFQGSFFKTLEEV